MIEAWWRQLKHAFLFMHVLDSAGVVTSLVGCYVEQHNAVVGRALFRGRTPDEVYHGHDVGLPQRLADHRAAARKARLAWSRSRTCCMCSTEEELVSIQSHRTNDGVAA